ncbi:HEPN domain-containing protein [Bradyrhizobium frederickii]|uniref:HEPN domain-containing protein n=1 Tax=Bradyrhizobium frederickii TaxID=2560054 RepID=A0A4Y9P6R9_9BRAD|nr:HEPN domain-containing protein [Bradyrhizobium frederickii]TFV75307.1 HEPN domain-containing protein [Bradyrhizobium frederickii]
MIDTDEGPLQFDIPDHVFGPERTLLQAFNLWFNPEVHRRVTAGTLKIPFHLRCAQVLFRSRQPPEVRFNGEISGAFEIETTRAVKAGDPVYSSDIAKFQRYELDLADADAGHLTVYKHDDGKWQIFFDFQQNKRSAADLVASAEQFAATAEFALSQGLQGPFIDNLYNSSELLARARLITAAHEDEVRTHRTVGAKINWWSKLGNVDRRFVELFNELSRVREQARYRAAAPVLKIENPIERVRAEIVSLRDRLSRFSDDP